LAAEVVAGQAPEVLQQFLLVVEAETCQAMALQIRLLNVRLRAMVLQTQAEVVVVEQMVAVDISQSATWQTQPRQPSQTQLPSPLQRTLQHQPTLQLLPLTNPQQSPSLQELIRPDLLL
jgi:hypothetical protein